MTANPEVPFMSGNTTPGELTPRTASARVDRPVTPDNDLLSPNPSTKGVPSHTASSKSPVPRAVNALGRPPMQKNPAQLSIDHELTAPAAPHGEEDTEFLVVDFTPSREAPVELADASQSTNTTTTNNNGPATTTTSPSAARLRAKGEAARGLNFPSWRERRQSQGRPRAPSSHSARYSSTHDRALSPSSQRLTLLMDEERDAEEQERKFRIVRNLFASHEDGVRFCIILEQLLAIRAIASQEFDERLKLLPKHEAARLQAMKEKEDARRRAREDRIWDVQNVVRRAVPTEPPALLAKLFNKGTSTDAGTTEKAPSAAAAAQEAAERRKAAEAARKAEKEKDAMTHKMASLENALQDLKSDNAQLKTDLAAAQARNREADLVESTRPSNVPRNGSSSLPSYSHGRAPSSNAGGHDGDLWAAIEELRRAVASLNQRVGSIEQREQMSLMEAIAQLRRDLQQLDQRAALMEGRQRAALGW